MVKIIKTFFLLLGFLVQEVHAYGPEVYRDSETRFPVCLVSPDGVRSLFLRWSDLPLSRSLSAAFLKGKCSEYKRVLKYPKEYWRTFQASNYPFIPKEILLELKQVEQKTNILRSDYLANDYLKNNPLDDYTVETNRELTKKYGQIFSAQVFKAYIEKKRENRLFLSNVLKNLENKNKIPPNPFLSLRKKVKMVVSFGLGWQEKYGITSPYYIEDFLSDMKSLGLEIYFFERNPFGPIPANVDKIVPQLKTIMESGEDIVLVSLCKGTPELLAAEAELAKSGDDAHFKGRILGHINLSGMLGGVTFSDYSDQVILPKVTASLMKLIPFGGIRDSGKMVNALKFMTTPIIEEILKDSSSYLNKKTFYVNVTGAPMSTNILEGSSPMKTIVKYGIRKNFVDSANDGFLELPNTLIPSTISENQVTLVLDSTHLLSDGELYGFKFEEQANRRALYYSVLRETLMRDSQYSHWDK